MQGSPHFTKKTGEASTKPDNEGELAGGKIHSSSTKAVQQNSSHSPSGQKAKHHLCIQESDLPILVSLSENVSLEEDTECKDLSAFHFT